MVAVMSIFKFTDSRRFLRSYLAGLPKKGRGEARQLAQHLRVSTTLVSQVLAEQKSFTAEQAQRVITYLGLSEVEADYFMHLIQVERSGSAEVKKYWLGKLQEIRERGRKLPNLVKFDRVLNEQERSVFYSAPIYSAIRLFTSLNAKGKSVGDVAQRFQIPLARATEILRFLAETGLCVQHADRYQVGPQSTHLEPGSPHLLKHHNHWRVRAMRRCEDLSEKELMYTAPISISEADFALLRESMIDFIKGFLQTVKHSPAEELACFNLDFFWLKS
jgi:uncharacterized protein (TIGR02147 family)